MKLVESSLEYINAVIHALDELVASHVVFSRYLGRVVCGIIYPAGRQVYPSIFDPVYENFIGNVEIDDEIDGLLLLIEGICEVVCLLCSAWVAVLRTWYLYISITVTDGWRRPGSLNTDEAHQYPVLASHLLQSRLYDL